VIAHRCDNSSFNFCIVMLPDFGYFKCVGGVVALWILYGVDTTPRGAWFLFVDWFDIA
jgi:hypothetical protein